MRWSDIFRLRLRSIFSRAKVERELDEELRYHLDRQIDEYVAAGMSRRDARLAALRTMGAIEPNKEECRDSRGLNPLDHLWRDTLFALRQLKRSPGFTATAVLMLALGICASSAIFAFVDAALLQPLPYRDPARLVDASESVAMIPRSPLSFPDYADYRQQNQVFTSFDLYTRHGFLLNTPGGAETARGVSVSAGFFRTLGTAPILGRDFHAGEDAAPAPRTAMLSYTSWQSRYAGNRGVLGKTVVLDGLPHIIIGVLPRGFHFGPTTGAEFWTAFQPTRECDLRRSCHSLWAVGRLKDGVSVEAAAANMKALAARLEQQYPESNRGQGAAVTPLSEVIVGQVKPILRALFGGALLLLLIAVVNVASLLLVRSENRRREIAVRNALGASAGRLLSQFLAEGLVLVASGAVLGLAAAHSAMQLLLKLIPEDMMLRMPFLSGLALNARVSAFACAVSLLALFFFTVIPALRLPSAHPAAGLADGSRGSAGLAWRRVGSKLVVLELATAMVLLVGAGLLGKSLKLLLEAGTGLRPDHLATLPVAAPREPYGRDERTVALARDLLSRAAAIPGVQSAAIGDVLPLDGNGNTDWIRFPGRPYNGEHNEVNQRQVTPEYFTTLGTRLIRGRFFTKDEGAAKPRTVIVNQALARKYYPGEDPIGKQIANTALSPDSMREIVGIVEDLREGTLDEEIWPAIYQPFYQMPSRYFYLVVRTAQPERSLFAQLSATVRAINPEIVTLTGSTMRERIEDSESAYRRRSSAWVVGGFAAAAFLLSVAGLYGVVAYSVSRRTREIGVRMALGAGRGSVYRLILREAAWLTAFGTVLGIGCSIAGASLIRNLLFRVEPWDSATLAIVGAVLAASALAASFLPARRAASVNPVEALRTE
jgi:macrolide transport system ATP-binding/permease protein